MRHVNPDYANKQIKVREAENEEGRIAGNVGFEILIMTTEEKEKIYDEEIAPVLLALMKRCQELEMSFVAQVEYDPLNEGYGRTEFQMQDEMDKISAAQRLVHWASRSNGNIDSLMMACDKHGRKHGHSSMYLYMAGNKNTKTFGVDFAALTTASK